MRALSQKYRAENLISGWTQLPSGIELLHTDSTEDFLVASVKK
jgi:hypothetical protein